MFKKNIKRFVQGIFIFLFFYLLKKTTFPLPEKLPVNFFFRIDLLLAVFTTVSALHFSYLFWPSLIVFPMLLLLGNFFCFWICPFGGIIDYINMVLVRKKWKLEIKCPNWLRKIKVYIFCLIMLTSISAIFINTPFIFWIFDPYVILTRTFLFKNMAIIFTIIILISILVPRFWCNNICPLGYINYLIGVKLRNNIKRKLKK